MIVNDSTDLGQFDKILEKIGVKGETVNTITQVVSQVRDIVKSTRPKTTLAPAPTYTPPQLAPVSAGWWKPWMTYTAIGGGVVAFGTVLYFLLKK